MTAELLASAAGIVLSLVLAYVPGLNTKYDGLDGAYKRAILALLLGLVAVGAFAAGCTGFATQLGITAECSQSGAVEIAKAFVAALVASQGAYLLLVRKPAA